jgi:zinc protease
MARLRACSRFAKAAFVPMLAVLLLALPTAAARAALFHPETFTLANGLQVVVVPNRNSPAVTQMVWYKAGRADEQPGKSGIAHFLEHLMFKGTRTTPPGEFDRLVARNGGRQNAFTSQDYTAFYQTVAKDRLALVMRLEADRMTNLTLSDDQVTPERQVIIEERRMRVDNDPAAQFDEQLRASLFLNQGYRVPVIGWKQEMEGLDRADALAWYGRWYAPNNAILIVAGDVSAAEVRPLAEKYYGVIPARALPACVRPSEPPHRAAARLEMVSARVRMPSWTRYYLAPSRHTDARAAYALEVLQEILGGGATSRLYKALVVEQKLAIQAGAGYDADALDRTDFALYLRPHPGVPVDKAEAAMNAELDRLVRDGVTAEEVERAKRRMVAATVYALDSLQAGARIFGAALATGGTVADVEAWPERIAAVTVEEVNQAAKAVLDPVNSVTGVLRPKTAG